MIYNRVFEIREDLIVESDFAGFKFRILCAWIDDIFFYIFIQRILYFLISARSLIKNKKTFFFIFLPSSNYEIRRDYSVWNITCQCFFFSLALEKIGIDVENFKLYIIKIVFIFLCFIPLDWFFFVCYSRGFLVFVGFPRCRRVS